MNDHEKKLALYDAWANQMVLRSLDSLPAWDERVTKLVNHLLASKQTWLRRIRLEDTAGANTWPTLPVSELPTHFAKADAELIALTIRRADLKSPITYKNLKGEIFSTPLRDIIIHMVNHGTYHRGQIAVAVKNAGGTPAVTDYIAWTRTFPSGTIEMPRE